MKEQEQQHQQQINHDLDQLQIFKKEATLGRSVIQLKGVSYLCCALLETVRVYPPVWTLPRILQRSSKFDDAAQNEKEEVAAAVEEEEMNPKFCKVHN